MITVTCESQVTGPAGEDGGGGGLCREMKDWPKTTWPLKAELCLGRD